MSKVRVQHLLVKHNESRNPSSWKSPTITRTKAEALRILATHREAIANGHAKFGILAHTHSDCSSARNEGDLGFFSRGEMQKPFEDAAFALAIGEMSGFVDTPSGVHIIRRTA